MRKTLGILSMGALAAILFAQGSGTSILNNFAKTLSGANSLEAQYSFQRIGGTKVDYTVQLAKPNLVRIDKPGELIVADGQSITIYNKENKTYFQQPQTEQDMKALLTADELTIWSSFFNGNEYGNVSSKNLGKKNRKGTVLTAVELPMEKSGKKVLTLYVAPDNIARQAEIVLNDPNGQVSFVVDTKNVALNGVDSNAFTFKAPEGSRMLTAEEMNSAQWYTDLEEAKKVAAKTNRKIFVDFMATWCGPCKMLDAEVLTTEEFKKTSKHLVFVKIDVDRQPGVSKAYNVTAMPTQMVLNADGTVVATKVGYGGPADFYQFLNGSLK